ncbi:hypothetical protein CVT24_007775 [Panaeolus cyanescens]|uniref:Uncharacterized protein n=1 Tax=Panaeolus cyanescens TaxID=181874 RepID=A0A409YKS2_9AGAR|nr:hypothetical protein CVT24_007775 [Panaeolus cyanescens]
MGASTSYQTICAAAELSARAAYVPHLYRLVEVTLETVVPDRQRLPETQHINDVLDLWEQAPVIKQYVQQLSFQLEQLTWSALPSETEFERYAVSLLSLPAVKSISISYSDLEGAIRKLTTSDRVGALFTRLIEACAARKTLHTLSCKKMAHLPYRQLFASGTLTTLSLDRCGVLPLTEPIRGLKSLTLRKMPLRVSTLSFFPDLDYLCIIRASITKCDRAANLPPPSFGLKTLTLDLLEYAFIDSASTFLKYYYDQAEQRGVKPFSHLAALAVVVDDYSELSVIEPLLKDISGTLQSFTFGVFPPTEMTVMDFLKHLRTETTRVSLRYQSIQWFDLSDGVNLSSATVLPLITSSYPSFPFDHILERAVAQNTSPEDSHNSDHDLDETDFTLWLQYVATLPSTLTGFMGINEVYVYVVMDDSHHNYDVFIKQESDISDAMAQMIAIGGGGLFATRLDRWNGAQGSRAQIMFHRADNVYHDGWTLVPKLSHIFKPLHVVSLV